jgi:transformation/transcription domain-associated protein
MMQQQQPYIATDQDILYVKAVVRPTAEEMSKILGYLEIFSLLPSAAEYLGQLISIVLKLASAMSRVCCLPFRASLLKFLNKYPAASVEYFLQNIGNEEINAILCDALRSDLAGPLRQDFLQ